MLKGVRMHEQTWTHLSIAFMVFCGVLLSGGLAYLAVLLFYRGWLIRHGVLREGVIAGLRVSEAQPQIATFAFTVKLNTGETVISSAVLDGTETRRSAIRFRSCCPQDRSPHLVRDGVAARFCPNTTSV